MKLKAIMLLVLGIALTACGPTDLDVVMTGSEIIVKRESVPEGPITFALDNHSGEVQQLLIQAPSDSGIPRTVAEIDDIKPGRTRYEVIDLDGGVYTLSARRQGKGPDEAVDGESGRTTLRVEG